MWEPDKEAIKTNEIIGRRLFGKDVEGQIEDRMPLKGLATPKWFKDTRYDQGLSVDRKGQGGVQRPTRSTLTKIADEAARLDDKEFKGWAAIPLSKLEKHKVLPDPLSAEKDGLENPYHALIDRTEFPSSLLSHHCAVSLAFYYNLDGYFLKPIR